MARHPVPYGPLPGTREELCAIGTNGHSLRAIGAHLSLSRQRVYQILKASTPRGLTAEQKHRRLLRAAERSEAQAAAAQVAGDEAWAETNESLARLYRLLAKFHAPAGVK